MIRMTETAEIAVTCPISDNYITKRCIRQFFCGAGPDSRDKHGGVPSREAAEASHSSSTSFRRRLRGRNGRVSRLPAPKSHTKGTVANSRPVGATGF